jgi:hypothetical protein
MIPFSLVLPQRTRRAQRGGHQGPGRVVDGGIGVAQQVSGLQQVRRVGRRYRNGQGRRTGHVHERIPVHRARPVLSQGGDVLIGDVSLVPVKTV